VKERASARLNKPQLS